MEPKQRIQTISILGVPCKLYRVIRPDNTLGGWAVCTDTGRILTRDAMTMQKYAIEVATDKIAATQK